MQVTRSENLKEYYDVLRDNTDEAQALLGDLLISVTTFFRDGEAFEALRRPSDRRRCSQARSRRGHDPRLGARLRHRRRGLFDRHAAAGGGGDARSIRPSIQVFGSDLDARALADGAREGRYPGGDRSRCQRGPPAAVFCARRRPLPRTPGAARLGVVCRPQPPQGPAIFPHRSRLLPQPAHLSRSRPAAAGLQHVSLCAKSGRLSVPRLVRDRRQSAGAVPQRRSATLASINRPAVPGDKPRLLPRLLGRFAYGSRSFRSRRIG